MAFEIIGTDHLKARCVCESSGEEACPLHQVPVIVYQERDANP